MSIKETLQGPWCLLVEEEPYSTEGRTVLTFRDGMMMDGDGVISPLDVDGETVTTRLADNVRLTINPGDVEMRMPPASLPADVERIHALVTTSFDDDSDDLVEYALLCREAC